MKGGRVCVLFLLLLGLALLISAQQTSHIGSGERALYDKRVRWIEKMRRLTSEACDGDINTPACQEQKERPRPIEVNTIRRNF